MYRLIYGIFYLISLLPTAVLYAFSDFVAFVLDKIFRYRRHVIMENLGRMFPEKPETEKTVIATKFYHRFTDTWMETIMALSMGAAEFDRRVTFHGSAIAPWIAAGRSLQLDSLHQINWEYGSLAASKNLGVPFLAVYKKIGTQAIDRLFLKIRSRFGAVMTEVGELGQTVMHFGNQQFALGLIADQTPHNSRSAYWLDFMHTLTGFLPGPEITAKRHNLVVFFTRTVPNTASGKRGHYIIENIFVTADPDSMEKGELLLKYRDFVEASVRQNPEYYLWSHKRFKHRYESQYAKNLIKNPPNG